MTQRGAYTKGNSERVTIEGVTIGRETEKAVLVKVGEDEHWIPLSQVHEMHRTKTEGTDTIVVSAWIASEKGIG